MFTFKHKHPKLKKIVYTAIIEADHVLVTWTEKGQEHQTKYEFYQADFAILNNHWILL